MRRVFQAAAFQRHQTLIAAHVRALIDGHGEMAVAEQRTGIRRIAEPRLVETGIGSEPVRRLKVDNQERHRSVGLGLKDEAAVELERRAEQRRQHDRLAEQLADRGGIVVTDQQLVEGRTEPGQPSAQIERAHLERNHGVIDGTADGARTGVSSEIVGSDIREVMALYLGVGGPRSKPLKAGFATLLPSSPRAPMIPDVDAAERRCQIPERDLSGAYPAFRNEAGLQSDLPHTLFISTDTFGPCRMVW